MRQKLLEMVVERGDLPEFPQLLGRLDAMMADPDVGLRDIADLVATDPVLVGRLLKLANSALFSGGRREATEIHTAVQRLGAVEVRKVLYSIQMSTLFSESELLDHRAFWRHSLSVALFTQSLHKYISSDARSLEKSYLAGLMHDVGVMVFATLIPDAYQRFLASIGNIEEVPLHTQEQRAFGLDHAELGAAFVKAHWSDDEEVISGIRQHHFPFGENPERQQLAQVVHVANAICDSVSIQNGVEVWKAPFEEGAWVRLGLRLEYAQEILSAVQEAVNATESMLAQ
jgi:HD-like signal output (HDOD) protein